MPLPRVVLHTAVSLDGHVDGFEADLAAFYGVVGEFHEDATLAGSETLLAAPGTAPDPAGDPVPPPPEPGDRRPLLAVADSRGRVKSYNALRRSGFWREAVALCTEATPPRHLEHLASRRVEVIQAGEASVDLRAALEALAERHAVRVVRVESGGTLAASLLSEGLVAELSFVVHPVLARTASRRSFFRPRFREGALPLRLLETRALDGGIAWLRYEVCAVSA